MRRIMRMPLRLLVVAVAAVGTPVVLSATSATASTSRLRVQTAAALPGGAHALGAMRTTASLKLTVALRPQSASALQSFATAVSTPGSASYRHFLTVDQFAKRFGATSAQISAVQSQLRSQGLTVGAPSPNHLTLPVSGSVARVQSAFSTKLSTVKLSDGHSTYFNSQAVALPASVAGDVQGVIGLDGAAIPRPQYVKAPAGRRSLIRHPLAAQDATGGPQPCSQAAALQNQGYTADQLATAYHFPPYYAAGDFGQGQTVALFEEGAPYPQSDVGQFQGCYGTTGTVTLVPVDGGPGPYNANDPNSVNGDGEVTLDIDVVNEMAPKANILVYSAPATAAAAIDTLTAIVSQNQAKVVSISYGACEANTPATTSNAQNTLLQEAAAQGQSVFASSGDAGDAMCSQQTQSNTRLSVIDPGNQPFITSVGGTTLGPHTATAPTEGVWNSVRGSRLGQWRRRLQELHDAGLPVDGRHVPWPDQSRTRVRAAAVGAATAARCPMSRPTPRQRPATSCSQTAGGRNRWDERLVAVLGGLFRPGQRVEHVPGAVARLRQPGAVPDRRERLPEQLLRRLQGQPGHGAGQQRRLPGPTTASIRQPPATT